MSREKALRQKRNSNERNASKKRKKTRTEGHRRGDKASSVHSNADDNVSDMEQRSVGDGHGGALGDGRRAHHPECAPAHPELHGRPPHLS